ncbi:MAG: membrane protein insertase YidC [Ilumatobacteraceae bacterium]
MFEAPAWLLSWFYSITNNYIAAISLIAVVVMALITPLTLKSTKGMLEMQRLGPQMRRLQAEHRGDRQKLNEEMMKLYQEHKVNPMASCLPLLAQMPVFIIMFQVLNGLTYRPIGEAAPVAQAIIAATGQPTVSELGFVPRYLSHDSSMFQSLFQQDEMRAFGLDLAKSPATALSTGLGQGIVYALLVVALAGLYFLQQRMVAARAAVSPTMSPMQQKIMQYLPVVFAVFQVFFLAGLIIYYMAQALLRIGQQAYITRRFYGHDESLGRQAQRASETARELAKEQGGGGGIFSQAKRDLTGARADASANGRQQPATPPAPRPSGSKRTTAPKSRPTPTGKASRAPAPRPGGGRAKSGGKRRR